MEVPGKKMQHTSLWDVQEAAPEGKYMGGNICSLKEENLKPIKLKQ